MAKKRPSRDDDDDDDDRPRKRRRSRDEDEEDEDDTPRQRGRKRDDDDEDDDRPRKRRRSRDDEDDDEDQPEDQSEEGLERERVRKQALARQQMLSLLAGITKYRQRALFFLYLLGALLGASALGGGAYFLYGTGALAMAGPLVGLVGLGWVVVPQLMAMQAGGLCKAGPPEVGGHGLLNLDRMLCAFVMIGFLSGGGSGYVSQTSDGLRILEWAGAAISLAAYLCLFATFIVELFYLRRAARFLRDKFQARAAQGIAYQHMLVNFASIPLMGVAGVFATYMGNMGLGLIGAMALVFLLFFIKGFFDVVGVCDGLNNTISKRLLAEDKPKW